MIASPGDAQRAALWRRWSDAPVTALGSATVVVFALSALLLHALVPLSSLTTAALVVAGTFTGTQGLRLAAPRNPLVPGLVVLGAAATVRVLFFGY